MQLSRVAGWMSAETGHGRRRSIAVVVASASAVIASFLFGAPVRAAPAAGDPSAGQAVFGRAGCGACHTLAAAGATGKVGPNLDAAKPSADRVVQLVTNGRGAMPPFGGRLSAKEIADVAAFVSQASRSQFPSAGGSKPGPSTGTKRVPVRVSVREWRLLVRPGRVAAGPVTFVIRNDGKLTHRLVVLRTDRPAGKLEVRDGRVSERGLVAAVVVRPGQTVSVTLRLQRGRYVVICNERGHYRRGLVSALQIGTATAGSPPPPTPPTPPPVPTTGRELFRAFCGGCHTLADAQTLGTKGPNLDDERPDCDDALKAMRGGEDEMPSFASTLTDEQMAKIAVYVATASNGDPDDCD